MIRKSILRILTATIITTLTLPAGAATVYSESGDAGNTFATAQSITGPVSDALTSISGTLSSGDTDFFRFIFQGPGDLTLSDGPYGTSGSFPAFTTLTLFDVNGVSLGGSNPLGGGFIFVGYISGLNSLTLLNLTMGSEYILGVAGNGQINDPKPIYAGAYTISITNAATIARQSVPEPASLALLGLGFAGMRLVRRKAL